MEIAHDALPWQAWSPEETAARLEQVSAPWGIAAGWALALFARASWRGHDDLEIAVPAVRFGELRAALEGLELWAPVRNDRLRRYADAPATHQTWVLDPAVPAWRLDVFREPSDGDTWICRREPTIRMAYARLIERTADQIPFLRPEVVLLFKAKATRAKDDADFAVVAPRLDRGRREWLRAALHRVHPGHAWIDRLD